MLAYVSNARQKSSKIASRHKLAAILDIVGNVRYRRRERSVASRLPKRDRKLSDYNRKGYRAFPTAVADIPDYIQDGRQLATILCYPRHTIYVDYVPYIDELAELFGVRPNLTRYFNIRPSYNQPPGEGSIQPTVARIQTQWDQITFPTKTRPVKVARSGEMPGILKLLSLFILVLAIVFKLF
ncbi:Cyclopentanone 1,2-monooxygenase (CPMO) [Branchiostoma belcheri]|nr:Cyclopentanone 1,2-monooxygenase (CPMO) [Branchiostoma belcheri]